VPRNFLLFVVSALAPAVPPALEVPLLLFFCVCQRHLTDSSFPPNTPLPFSRTRLNPLVFFSLPSGQYSCSAMRLGSLCVAHRLGVGIPSSSFGFATKGRLASPPSTLGSLSGKSPVTLGLPCPPGFFPRSELALFLFFFLQALSPNLKRF